MFDELTRGELLVAATYVLSGLLIALSALTDPTVPVPGGLLAALVLLVVPPLALRDIVATKRLADPEFGSDALLADD